MLPFPRLTEPTGFAGEGPLTAVGLVPEVGDIVAFDAAEGRTVLLASHEVERTRPLVTREVRIVGGRVAAPVGGPVGDQ